MTAQDQGETGYTQDSSSETGKSANTRELRAWIVAIVILIIVAVAAVMAVQAVKNATQNALQPIQTGSDSLRTQVANLLNPTPTILPDPVTIIHDIRTLARLETIQYSVEKVITAETAQGLFRALFGDRLLLVAHGVVIAGVDLSKITPEDLQLENGVLTVRLPEAEIFVATLDNDKSYVYDRETGLFTRGDINLETQARQAAEEEIRRSAIEDGILDLAQVNAEHYLSRLLMDLGYADVIFVPAGDPLQE
jgi:hypothetical protein